MRVLLVTHYSLPHIGGIEVLVDIMARELARRGHEVTLVSSRSGAPTRETRDGVRVIRTPALNFLERWLHVPYPLFAPSLVPLLYKEIRSADIVHVHGLLYLGSLCSLSWATFMNKPIVITEHVGFVPYRNPLLNAVQRVALSATARLFLSVADAIITYNSGVRSWLEKKARHPERHYFVPNGVDTERFRPPASNEERQQARRNLDITANRPVALFVGRFVEKKGVDLMLDAAGGDFQLVLCGSGELPRSPDAPSVHILRDIDHACMPEVYRAADLFVLPSKGEGFPVAIMEAMASGLPVVAVRDPSYATHVGDTEMVQTESNPDSLRHAIESLFRSGDDLRRRGLAARARAVENFSLATSVERHLEIFEKARQARNG